MIYIIGVASAFMFGLGVFYTYHTGINMVTFILLFLGGGGLWDAWRVHKRNKMLDQTLADMLEKKDRVTK